VRIDEVDGDRIPPTIFFAAQRSSLVREAIRYARERRDEYEDSNRDFDREMDWQQRLDEADDAVDTWRNDSSEFGRRWYARALYDRQFLIQCNALAAADNLAAHVVSSYAGRRPRDPQAFVNLDASMIDLLSTMPYAMNLGPLPGGKR
jgi:hypothetical protein